MKKYLLLGGTGPIGIHLVKKLSEDFNNEIFVTSRKEHKSSERVHFIKGNAKNIDFLKSTIMRLVSEGGITAIVDFMVWRTEDFSNVCELLLSNCRQYVYLSSSRLYANVDELISENSPRLLDVTTDSTFLRNDDYALPKARQEDLLINSGYKNYTIIRPYITYAENRLPLCSMEKEIWLYRALKGRTIVMPKDVGNCYTSLTYGQDAANAISTIVANGLLIGETINITTNEALRWLDVLGIYISVIEKRTGKKVRVKYRDKSIKAKQGDYQTIYDRMCNRRFDNSKLSTIVDTNKFFMQKEGLSLSLNKLLDDLTFNPTLQNWTFQAQLDNVTGEYAHRSEFGNAKQYFHYLLWRLFPYVLFPLKKQIKNTIKLCTQFWKTQG